jgi:DNA-binding transcriptional LysR family regulator
VPLSVAERFARQGTIAVLPVPFDPTWFLVQQYWHRVFHRDPRLAWLRRQVAALFNDQSDRWRRLEASLYGQRRRRDRA